MQINVHWACQLLRDFDFETLLIEGLGWAQHNPELNTQIREKDGDESEYLLTAIAQKRGVVVFLCSATSDGGIPNYTTRCKIEQQATKSVHEHLIIYTDAENTTQIWQWVKREPGKPLARREHRYHRGQSGDALIQKLQTISVSIDEEEKLTLVEVTGHVRAAFDVERVTKRFYDHFKTEHAQFLKFLKGIPDLEMQRWYASVMLNRLMFIYFIQKKGFLNNDTDYLRTKLTESQADCTDQYYTAFLCQLFFEGFAKPEDERSAGAKRLLGAVPYLNGGIFQQHQIEGLHGEKIEIADVAFEGLFNFFDQYQWHLDDRTLQNDNEINPDVLGYIFEKHINQKQMGAYYTKEDITEYIGKNTIIPFLFDSARKACPCGWQDDLTHKIAFEGESSVWQLLKADPDRYIYDAVKKGVKRALPPEIAAGIDDVSKRTAWNTPAPDEYALPTEIWREVVARRERYESICAKLSNGEIDQVNALITDNLNIRQFAHDVIENCEGPELLRTFWNAITGVTILDPTCGSGAFLFAALNILEPLYEACLERMQVFVDELQYAIKMPRAERFRDFRDILERIEQHPNHRYFILKSIIINNLYGVDIMEEAIEICKLRLFLKMVAQIEDVEQIEPLPDIDFNIQAGNTLVGYATYDEVEKAITGKLDFDNTMKRIEGKAEDVEQLFEKFRQQQTELGGVVTLADKQALRDKLQVLEDELNQYLSGGYGIKRNDKHAYQNWLSSHKPFHWFIEFYGILKDGGFDVIIGNPPYVSYSKAQKEYRVIESNFETIKCGNLYTLVTEKVFDLAIRQGRFGIILPLSSTNADGNFSLQSKLRAFSTLHISHFAVRPSKLFVGVDMNLTIICGTCDSNEMQNYYTTSFLRWPSSFRPFLFPNLSYVKNEEAIKILGFAKFGNDLEISIWSKLSAGINPIASILAADKMDLQTQLAFHSFGRYWRKCIYEKLSDNYQVFDINEKYSSCVLCLLNSQLSYWYWIISSDCYRFTKTDALNISMPLKPDLPLYTKLAELLLKSYEANSILQKKKARNRQIVIEKQFFPAKSKPIIDEIDSVLAQHYGLTNEELDFIINYDIKYRMGLGN